MPAKLVITFMNVDCRVTFMLPLRGKGVCTKVTRNFIGCKIILSTYNLDIWARALD